MLGIIKYRENYFEVTKTKTNIIDSDVYANLMTLATDVIAPSAVVYGAWYTNCSEYDQSVKTFTDFNKINLISISGNVNISSTFDSEVAQKLKVVECYVQDEEEYEEEDEKYEGVYGYLCISVSGKPSFLIDQHSFGQFERLLISNDDKYIVLVWSRYICVFDITNKCCIYLCDCEESYTGEMSSAFQNMKSIINYTNGIVLTFQVANNEEEKSDIIVTFMHSMFLL